MTDCISDSTGKRCINCGWQWKRDTPFPRRNCDNPPDLRPAMSKLEWTGAIPPGMAPRLAKWIAEGMPERDAEEVDRLWHAPCDDRRNSGMCGKIGCTKAAKGYHVACLWLARMATESCPAKKW